jgi:hypothetical protein
MLQDRELMERVGRNVPVIRERVGLPDRFNALLGPLGWVAFEEMDAEVAKVAVLLAEAGAFDGAESVLVRHYDAETVARGIERLAAALEPFRVRKDLLMRAVEDHREGRYHASVPVALAQLDGVVRDLTGGKSFFVDPKRSEHLLAHDSIPGHPSGLASLSAVMSKGRRRTSLGEIGTPYRHGILHGRELNYANEKVSAKSFAALLALGSWAEVAREARTVEPMLGRLDPDEVRPKDLVQVWQSAAAAILRSWFPRAGR